LPAQRGYTCDPRREHGRDLSPADTKLDRWTRAMRNISAAPHGASGARSGKLSAAGRSSLNQALAKALAFRDAGKMPEAREWAAELIRLLKCRVEVPVFGLERGRDD